MYDYITCRRVKFQGILLLVMWTGGLSACTDAGPPEAKGAAIKEVPSVGRWYSLDQVALGETVYERNCVSCHNPQAKGTFNWKKPTDDGSYPPPPLNGSAHAWHHPLPALLHTINEGGAAYGGKMPPFKAQLEDAEKKAVIAYFQSFWSDEIYRKWESLHEK